MITTLITNKSQSLTNVTLLHSDAANETNTLHKHASDM